MKILVLGGDGYLGWPTALHLSERGHDVAVADNFVAPAVRRRTRRRKPGPDRASADPDSGVAGGERQAHRALYRRPVRRRLRLPDDRRVPARRHRPLRRAAVRAVLDDRPAARRLHPDQQRRRQPQRALRHRRHEPGHPPGQARHDGRVRHAQHRHRRRLARGHPQGAHRPGAVPEAAGLLLPPVQGARQPQHRVRLPDLGAARHRPQPGRRVRPADRRDRRATDGWRPGSTTTPCSAPCSTGSSSRPCSASR